MVDRALLEQVMELDVQARRELVRAVEGSLGYDDIPADILETIDARLANKRTAPDSHTITLDEFERRIRAPRSA